MSDERRARLHRLVDALPDGDLDVAAADLGRYVASPDHAGLLYRTPDGGPVGTPPPWSAGDLRIAAEALNWPAVRLADGRRLAGEAAWRGAIEGADAAGRSALHAALAGPLAAP